MTSNLLNGNKPKAIAALDTLPTQFALTPVRAKAPYLNKWQSIDTTRAEIAQQLVSGQADGFGIKLGIPSGGICALDIDGTAARCKLIDVMDGAEMPITVEFASGKLDRSQYLFSIAPELWDSLTPKADKIPTGEKDAQNREITEDFNFRWTGNQSVLPPSAHPETDGYYWIQSPDDTAIAPIPKPLLEYWLNLITPPHAANTQPVKTVQLATKPQLKSQSSTGDILTIPIERLLTKEHRAILNGVSQGGRNNTGTSLARDLIGVATLNQIECDYRGKNYTLTIEGNPEDLFYSFCDGCSPPLSTKEGDTIWKSAQSSDQQPCIRDEDILKNCARSYLKEVLSKSQPKQPKTTKEINQSKNEHINHGLEFRSSESEGLWMIEKGFDKETNEIIETKHYIGNHLIGIARVKSPTGDGASIYLEFETYEDTINHWLMPRSATQFETPQMLAELLSRGYYFSPSKKKIFIEYLSALKQGIDQTYTITEQTGWVGNSYVSQIKTYSADEKSDLKFRDIEPIADSISEIKGTLAEWQAEIGSKCAGNSRLIFGIGIALGSPLQPLLEIESGGFHLVGTTSVGKTTILKVASSVVGIKNLTQWRTTTNGLESIACAHNHMLLPLDEIGQADPKDVGAIAYMLANGQGKTRMTKKLTNQKPKTWQLLFLSSGENGMAQYMAQAGIIQKGGQEVRLPDIPAAVVGSPYGGFETIHGCSTSKEFAENLNRAAHKYHGTLLDAFLEKLAIDVVDDDFLDNLKRRLREISTKLATGTTDNAVSRVSTRFALIQVALELAHGYGLLPFPVTDIEWAIQKMFIDWLNSRGGDGSVEMRSAINRIQHLLVTNEFSDRIYTLPDNNDRIVRNLLGYRKLDASGSTEEIWIPPSVFEKEVCENMNKSELIKELQRVGLMIPARSDGKPRHQRKIKSKPSYYYIFQMPKVPEASEAAESPHSSSCPASILPLPIALPTTGSGGSDAQAVEKSLPLPTLPTTGSGAEAEEDALNPYISTIHTPASTASDASGQKTLLEKSCEIELDRNDTILAHPQKESGQADLMGGGDLKVGDKVELMDSTHPRFRETGSVKYFSGWNPAVIWDVDGTIDISHKADDFQILNN
jgi:uncharacterized protein (DUF927 family)